MDAPTQMDAPTHFDSLLDKLEEVRAVFVLSKRSMPFLEEFFGFVQDVAPLIEEIDSAIRDSTGDMPEARSRLESVSQATELATTEILDLVDAVLSDLKVLATHRQRSAEHLAARAEVDERLMALLRDELGDDHTSLLARAEALHEKRQALPLDPAEVDAADDALSAVRDKMNRIMMSLQVQDITAQQIASVNHLIESVRSRLKELSQRFTMGTGSALPEETAAPVPFDAYARYDHAPDRQQMADAMVHAFVPGSGDGYSDAALDGAPSPAEASSEDSAEKKSSSEEPAPSSAPPEEPPAVKGEAVSQDDIDALFT